MAVREVGPAWLRQFIDLFAISDGAVYVENFDNPLAAVVDRYVASVNMKVGAYTVANGGLPGDGHARPVTATVTKVVENDTMGTLVIVGIDNDGVAITDTLTLNNGDTSAGLTTSVKAFKRVDSVTGAGWVTGGTPDTITVGFSAAVGLRKAAAADADVLTVYDKTSLAATASFAGKANGTLSGSYFTATGANGTLDYTVVYRLVQSTVLLANSAVTLLTTAAQGFIFTVEEFGFRVKDALAGAGGTLTFTLTDGSDNVIATLVVALADGAAGATIKTTTITADYAKVGEAGTLKLKRTATGTAFTSGSGTFYIKIRQRPQTLR